MKATVQRVVKNTFFAVDGGTAPADNPTIVATAVAAHRPRDIAILLDFSGSMNDESDLWNADTYFGPYYNLSNNSDPVVPTFGQYSSSTAALVSTSTAPGGPVQHHPVPTQGMPAEVTNLLPVDPAAVGRNPGTAAFTGPPTLLRQPSRWATSPSTSATRARGAFAQTANSIFGTSYTTSIPNNFGGRRLRERQPLRPAARAAYNYLATAGYTNLYTAESPAIGPSGKNQLGVAGFSGFTTGPGYWGKTFFQWPPDPGPTGERLAAALLHRRLQQAGRQQHDPLGSRVGTWNYPYNERVTNYHINYKAILNWITNVGPNPFPPTLQAGTGRLLQLRSPPTSRPPPTTTASPTATSPTPASRFWKEYIDYCLGVWRDPYGNVWPPGNRRAATGRTSTGAPSRSPRSRRARRPTAPTSPP